MFSSALVVLMQLSFVQLCCLSISAEFRELRGYKDPAG